jgi:uroporphyrinogen-III synthase
MRQSGNTLAMAQQSRPNLLLTRPDAQSQRFAGEVAARFGAMNIVISPLLVPRFLPATPTSGMASGMASGMDGVIFTSETGVAAALSAGVRAHGQPAYCVGARTAAAAQLAGFDARDAQGDWQDVAALITREGGQKSLAFLCAREAATHLQITLTVAGHNIARIEVYSQETLPLNPQAQALLAGARPVILPLFSPRSAQVFCAQAQPSAPIFLLGLSAAITDAFTLPFARKAVAHRPNSAALLDALAEVID